MWQQDKQIKEIIVIFKNFASLTNCISVINNTQIDDVKGIDVVMSTYTLIEQSNDYSETSGSLCQCYRDELNENVTDSKYFNVKGKVTGNILLMIILKILK